MKSQKHWKEEIKKERRLERLKIYEEFKGQFRNDRRQGKKTEPDVVETYIDFELENIRKEIERSL